MKRHILHIFSTEDRRHEGKNFFYDENTQISYVDESLSKKIVDSAPNRGTVETRASEISDSDIFCVSRGTKITETVEVSDRDELYLGRGTKHTYTVENSDRDEFIV